MVNKNLLMMHDNLMDDIKMQMKFMQEQDMEIEKEIDILNNEHNMGFEKF